MFDCNYIFYLITLFFYFFFSNCKYLKKNSYNSYFSRFIILFVDWDIKLFSSFIISFIFYILLINLFCSSSDYFFHLFHFYGISTIFTHNYYSFYMNLTNYLTYSFFSFFLDNTSYYLQFSSTSPFIFPYIYIIVIFINGFYKFNKSNITLSFNNLIIFFHNFNILFYDILNNLFPCNFFTYISNFSFFQWLFLRDSSGRYLLIFYYSLIIISYKLYLISDFHLLYSADLLVKDHYHIFLIYYFFFSSPFIYIYIKYFYYIRDHWINLLNANHNFFSILLISMYKDNYTQFLNFITITFIFIIILIFLYHACSYYCMNKYLFGYLSSTVDINFSISFRGRLLKSLFTLFPFF